MQKPLVSSRQGLADDRFSVIVPQATVKSQQFAYIELSNYIIRHELTNALDLLEQRGIFGDVAIRAIATVQMEVAR